MGSSSENFCLRWNDFESNVSGSFRELRDDCDFFDVTLATSDSGSKTVQAHKVILSACSNFFKQMLRQQVKLHSHPHPFIFLRGVSYNDLLSVLDFMYHGEVNVAQDDLNSFLAVAEELQIKGLTNKEQSEAASSKSRPPPSRSRDSGPPTKKTRRSSPATSSRSLAAAASAISDDDDVKGVDVKLDPEGGLEDDGANAEGFDDSYGEYYGDDSVDGAEAEGVDEEASGTSDGKASIWNATTHLRENPDGSCRCVTCNQLFKNKTTAKQHVRIQHEPPEYFECCICKKVIRSKVLFRSHVYSQHQIRGRDIVNSYGQQVQLQESHEVYHSDY